MSNFSFGCAAFVGAVYRPFAETAPIESVGVSSCC